MKKRASNHIADEIPNWQTIYCSLILILLVLFVMLTSYSVVDQGKMSDVSGNFAGSPVAAGAQGRTKAAPGYEERGKAGEMAWLPEAIQSFSKISALSGSGGDVALERTPEGLKCKFPSDAVFPAGDAALQKKLFPYLDELIRIAGKNDLRMKIEGHTDDVPSRSAAFPSNWELSAARAMNVLRYFLEKGNIPPERVTAAGYGQYRPLFPNDSPQGRAQNRRIEIALERRRN